MQLNSGESSFMTYFASEEEALSIVASLKAEGFSEVQLSYVSEFPQQNSYTGNYNLSSKILGRGHYDHNFGPLLAADPSVSGMSDQTETNLMASYLITVVTKNVDSDKVQQILNSNDSRH
ncbi:MAG TPA: hypothetical protein PKV15_10460 [Syntrophomonadaceae bacterium]|nr:hypothetical protein [Syntrophomonadaceae bacterium]HRX22172.1 hypothetical protein [Syntrophomonadaceae bacterium]